ncbi:restriction endonuclease subunit S [Shewanella sp. SR1]|uniref:restriction endonuclease subunit S n=1 Tax=Shewanella sp. SR1 TaxID=2855505 RepID=UPI001CF2E479|nr:restriction endonuclease subunit S [Shewanella sp. SR1]MCB2381709.1 restriction endonuclease subunit S [Shewanella sp. SR1]
MAYLSTPSHDGQSEQTAQSLITQNIDIWTTAIEQKSSAGRGTSNKFTLYGIKKLRELILELAVRGKLVPQDENDKPASVLLKRIAAEKAQLVKDKKIKKPKALPEISEEEKPFELPDGWEWRRLGALSYKLTDGSHNPARDNGEGYPMLSGQNVNYGRIDFENPSRYVDEPNFIKEDSRTQIEPKDILLTIVGSIGRSAVVPQNAPKFVLQRSVAVIQTSLNPEFLCNQFISPLCLNYYDEYGKGTAQKGIYLGQLSLMPIAIPPIEEQLRIVAKVDELMSLCDALEAQTEASISAHQTLVETLLNALLLPNTTQPADSESACAEPALIPSVAESFAQSWQRVAEYFDTLFTTEASIDTLKQTILQLAVMGKLVEQDENDEPAAKLLERIAAEKAQLIKDGKIKKQKPLPAITDEEKPFELPEGWEWVRFGNIAITRLGKMLDKAKNSGKPLPYLRNTNVQWHKFALDDVKLMKFEDSELDEFRVQVGDLLICEGGEPGRCAIWSDPDMEIYFQKAIHRARPFGCVMSKYLQLCLTVDAGSGVLDEYFTGATIKHFVGAKLNNYIHSLPPLEEQQRIVTKVDELMALCDQLKAHLTDAQTTQLHLTDAIVEQAI